MPIGSFWTPDRRMNLGRSSSWDLPKPWFAEDAAKRPRLSPRKLHDCSGTRAGGRTAALADYWLSYAQYQQENTAEAKAILLSTLANVRGGLKVEPDFTLRLLMAISSNESREGNHASALAYLEEVRGLAADLDDRRRAAYLYDLAHSYRETGDYEAALRAGIASLELYRHAEADRETATLENDLALSYLALGNTSKADELVSSSRRTFESLGDERALAHVIETQARITLAGGDFEKAVHQSTAALELAPPDQ